MARVLSVSSREIRQVTTGSLSDQLDPSRPMQTRIQVKTNVHSIASTQSFALISSSPTVAGAQQQLVLECSCSCPSAPRAHARVLVVVLECSCSCSSAVVLVLVLECSFFGVLETANTCTLTVFPSS